MVFMVTTGVSGGTQWRGWLRHCAALHTGSFRGGVIGIFHRHSGRTMALGPTQPLTEVSNRNISLG